MNPISYAEAKTQPLRTDEEIVRRVTALVEHAMQRQLWVLFLDDDNRQRELIIPIADLPESPDATAVDYLLESLAEIVRMEGGGSIILVRERPGDASLTRSDIEWDGAIASSATHAEVTVRASLLCHDDGVRWLSDAGESPRC
jgi:hypothetical protein